MLHAFRPMIMVKSICSFMQYSGGQQISHLHKALKAMASTSNSPYLGFHTFIQTGAFCLCSTAFHKVTAAVARNAAHWACYTAADSLSPIINKR